MERTNDVVVTVGEGVVTLKRTGSSQTTVATILGTVVRDGIEVICLDRLVHNVGQSQFSEWQVWGAVTTLLSRPVATAG